MHQLILHFLTHPFDPGRALISSLISSVTVWKTQRRSLDLVRAPKISLTLTDADVASRSKPFSGTWNQSVLTVTNGEMIENTTGRSVMFPYKQT